MKKIFSNVLPRPLLHAVEAMKDVSSLNQFYLAGGTGLALQLGHRVSIDLDFFSVTPTWDDRRRNLFIQDLTSQTPFILIEEGPGTIHGQLGRTHLSFFRYDYPLLRPLLSWEKIFLASIEDIALMKLGALLGRGAKKDFIDLYFILKQMPLEMLFKFSKRKFKHVRDFPFQALKAMTFFDEADEEKMPKMRDRTSWETIKIFFEKEVRSWIKFS